MPSRLHCLVHDRWADEGNCLSVDDGGGCDLMPISLNVDGTVRRDE